MPNDAQYYADVPRNKPLKQVLAENLTSAMRVKKLSQPKVSAEAKRAGHKIDQTTVGRIQRADIPTTVDTLDALAAGVGFAPWQLLVEGFDAEKPAATSELMSDERELLENYRSAKGTWKTALMLMSRLQGDIDQDEAASSMVAVLAKIAKNPASDERVKETLLTSRHGWPPGQTKPPPQLHEPKGGDYKKDKKS